MNKQAIKPGDLVRVSGYNYHGIKAGAVCRVVAVYVDDVLVHGPMKPSWYGPALDTQFVEHQHIKLAKQAMNKQGS